ncbi:MAG: hypothetical protein KDK78_00680, partial [Chlamydiia bacterium]|nr:hypothetical protein [Chlamydiia bacterium]
WLSGDPGLPEGMSDHLYFTNLRYLLHQSFSVLLTTKYKVGYRRKADLTAEPLEDGKAHRGMEFANPIQALAFTVQANLAEPYTSAEIRPYIDAVQEQLRVGNFQHPVAMLWRNRIAPELPGLPPLSDLKDLSLVCDLLNDPSRLELRLAFIHMYVLPRVTFTKAKLDSNPHIHIQALKHAIAASGTTRPETLPPQVRSIRDLAGVINTLMQLWNCSQDKVREIKGAHAREKLRSVLAEPKHRVLVDAAGEFLKLDVPVIAAEVFASRPEAHALVYYNDEGQLMALLRHERVSIPLHACTLEEQHFYYMLHRRYAIGADLPLPIDIQGYVTVDRLCDTTLLAQAAARLRYLGRGQVAHIGVPTEDRNTILANLGGMDSTLRLADILRWAAIVEGQDKGKQFYQAIGAFLGAHESEVFWGRVNSETSDETLLRFRELLTRNVPSSVRSSAHVNLHAQLAADVVESLLNDRVARWEGLRGAIPELGNKAFIEAFRRYVDLSKLPAQLAVGQAEPGHAVTLQQEEVAQEHGHTHQVGVEDAQRGSMQFDKVPQRPRTGCHRDWINSSSSIHLGDLAIHFSPNALGVAVPTDPRTQVEAVCLEFVVKRKRSDGSLSLLALGVEDSAYVIQQMETFKATPAEDFDYYLLNDTGCMGADAAMPYDSIKKALEGDIKLTLAMKLLSGNHLITDREEELWMHLRSDSQALLNHVQKLVPLRPELNRLLGL